MIFPIAETNRKISFKNGDELGNENRILNILKKNPNMTAKQISISLEISTPKISCIVKRLKDAGKIQRIGSDRKGYWKINKGDD